MHKPISFNVYPEKGKKDYFKVYIFKSKKEMMARAKRVAKFSIYLFDDFEAVTYIYEAYMKKKGRYTLIPRRGDVLFFEGGFGAGVVAHEMVHVANHYGAMKKWNFSLNKNTKDWKKWDEKYAWCVGSLCNQFWRRYKKNVNIHKEQY